MRVLVRAESVVKAGRSGTSPMKKVLSGSRIRGLVAVFGPMALLLLIGIFFPAAHNYVAQLMFIPILLAAATWGAGAASGVGLVASLDFAFNPLPDLNGGWVVQTGLFFGAAVVGAYVLRRTGKVDEAGQTKPTLASTSLSIGRESILESLARTVDVRDHHTQGHCRRVARNAAVLGRTVGLSTEELDILHWAAVLHDIGKIAVPEYILLKNGRLSEDEFAEIRRHPGYGADLLASVSPAFRPIADVVRAHHERWDGKGYPLGYRGCEIPRLARIIAIVDVFEALTSERPYRSPMAPQQALNYVRSGEGSQFDPELVPVFCSLVDQGLIECGEARTHTNSDRQSLVPGVTPNFAP